MKGQCTKALRPFVRTLPPKYLKMYISIPHVYYDIICYATNNTYTAAIPTHQ